MSGLSFDAEAIRGALREQWEAYVQRIAERRAARAARQAKEGSGE